MSATIKDVARISKVSIATVSKYLNGGNVKEQNRINIENAINELDYRVNTLARSLKTNKTMTAGIMVDNITNVFYTSIISVIEDKLSLMGYSTMICDTREDPALQKLKLDFLASKGVDGIIIFTTCISPELVETYVSKGISIIIIDTILNGIDCGFITTDNISGAYQATEQFIMKGHKKIAMITGEDKEFSAGERLKGYKRALEDYNIPLDSSLIFQGPYNLKGGYRLFQEMLLNKQINPTAVLIANYFMAIGAVISINENNVNIPDDLSIICFDDLELSKVFKPKLSFVSQQFTEIGLSAVELFLDRIDNKINNAQIVRIPPKIIITDSIKQL